MPLQRYAVGAGQRAEEALAHAHLVQLTELYARQLLARHSPDPWVRSEAAARPDCFELEAELVAVPDLRRHAPAGATIPAACVRINVPAGQGRRYPRVGFALVMFLADDFVVRPAQLTPQGVGTAAAPAGPSAAPSAPALAGGTRWRPGPP